MRANRFCYRPGATIDTKLFQVQLAGSHQKTSGYQILTLAGEALLDYPDLRARNLKGLEAMLQLRVVIGSPARSGASDPDRVGVVDWRLVIYSGAGGVEAALNFIHYILEYKVRKGYVARMPDLAARLVLDNAPDLPAPWKVLADASAAIPKPFTVLPPPKGRRRALVQLDPDTAYMLTFYGRIYQYKDPFDGRRVPGTLLATSADKEECSLLGVWRSCRGSNGRAVRIAHSAAGVAPLFHQRRQER